MKLITIRKALEEVVKSYDSGALIMANDIKEAQQKCYFVELLPLAYEKNGQLIEKSCWVQLRAHHGETTHEERLSLFEAVMEVLLNGLIVEERHLYPEEMTYKEVDQISELKFKLSFTTGVEMIESDLMKTLKLEV